jgi:translation initiation factor 1
LAKEEKKIKVYIDKRRYGKSMTVVDNISKDMNPGQILSELKRRLACGGTYKNGRIELQGNHLRKIEELLTKLGFSKDQIEIKG